jgi:CheY-like chemotaxis protein
MVRIVVVMEDQNEQDRIEAILSSWPDFSIEGRAKDGCDAICVVNALKPDILLADEQLPFFDGAGLPFALRHWSPRTRTIILTSCRESPLVLKAISNGAAGSPKKRPAGYFYLWNQDCVPWLRFDEPGNRRHGLPYVSPAQERADIPPQEPANGE